jgi:acetyl/propionyl-CoA carboxylase alpha subunit
MARRRAPRIRKLLVANRGEIALRVVQAARELGIETAAICGDADADALHTRAGDECFRAGGLSATEPYLRPDVLVGAARELGADAIHPGYGFLAESPLLARACEEAGIVFVGPPVACLELCGEKSRTRELAARLGVPVLPGVAGPPELLAREAARLDYPLLVKSAAGGGGRGIRRVNDPARLTDLLEEAGRESAAAFGRGELYLERFLPRARHIEFQILADGSGRTLELGERECSVQRRHQKIIEEAPAPALDESLRREMAAAAVKVASAAGYRGAGTVEFLLSLDGRGRPDGFSFLEVNARIQVEHPVTEAVTGIDLVAWQLRLASGEPLPPSLGEGAGARGHAIECRITAEVPPSFVPSTGRLVVFRPPAGPGVRCDAGYEEGDRVSESFDSLIAKVICHGADRAAALRRMELALASTVILGVETTTDYLQDLIRARPFREGRYTTSFLENEGTGWRHEPPPAEVLAAARAADGTADGAAAHAAPRAAPRSPWEEVRSLGLPRQGERP